MFFVTSSRSRGKAHVKISSPRFQKRGATKENRREGKRKKGKAKNQKIKRRPRSGRRVLGRGAPMKTHDKDFNNTPPTKEEARQITKRATAIVPSKISTFRR